MSLRKFIQQHNTMNMMFSPGAKQLDIKTLTAEDKNTLANELSTALSPEALTCDGEV